MLFIISPAKKMVDAGDAFAWRDMSRFLPQTRELLDALRSLSYDEAKALWKCSDALAALNYERVAHMDIDAGAACTPAVFSYEGIQYQNMAPQVMTENQLEYLQQHLRILSGFYGVLSPFDAVVPYRLEMQAKLAVGDARDLYGFWGPLLFEALADELMRQVEGGAGGSGGEGDADACRNGERLCDDVSRSGAGGCQAESGGFCGSGSDRADEIGGSAGGCAPSEPVIVNLASVEYAKAVLPYAKAAAGEGLPVRVLTCLFGTMRDGKFVQRSTEAKAARGTFVRWCAENAVERTADFKRFDAAGYVFDRALSTDDSFVFVH
ncbi:MAG: YaaA family protein [Slackia sp.]|nr:YaaA family protein [Slackia sp.]